MARVVHLYSLLVFLIVTREVSSQGSLRGSDATADSQVNAASASSADDNPEIDANSVLINDGSEILSRNTESSPAVSRESDADDKDAGGLQEDIHSDLQLYGSDSEVRSDLQEEAKDLRDELNGEEPSLEDQEEKETSSGDDNEDADKLQDEVSGLEDQMNRRDNEAESIKSDGLAGVDFTLQDDGNDDGDDDSNGTSELQTELNDAENDDESQSSAQDKDDTGEQDAIYNDTVKLKGMVDELLPAHMEKKDEPDVITVLMQTLRKHAHKLGSQSFENFEEDESADDEDDDMESSDGMQEDLEDNAGMEDEEEENTYYEDDDHEIEEEVDALENEGEQDAAAAEAEAGGEDQEAAEESEEALQDESESLEASEE